MNKLILTLAACASLSVSAFAQEPAKSDFGLSGKRYVGVDLARSDYRDNDADGLGIGLGVNLPVYEGIDLSFGYSFSDLDYGSIDARGHAIGATAIFYSKEIASFTPYFAAGIGSQWLKVDGGGSDSDAFWDAGIGAEFPIAGKTSGDIGVSYGDTFDSGDEGETTIYGAINHALTDKLTLQVGIASIENDVIVIHAGARLRF